MEQLVTNAPTPLAGLAVGPQYTLQNSFGDSYRVLRFAIVADAADVGAGSGVGFLQAVVVSLDAGESCFVWHTDLRGHFLCTFGKAG